MSTFDAILHLEKHANGDTAWGTGMRQNLDTLGRATAPERVYWVSPDFTDANLQNASATDRRHFDTIQAAIDAGEAAGYSGDDGYTILVFPGVYFERLTIAKSVAIVGTHPLGRFFVGGNAAHIRGDNTASAVIEIDPTESAVNRILLANLKLDNQYNVSNATQITAAPYLIDVLNQTLTGASANALAIEGCQMRMQTWGLNNKWLYGIQATGWWDFIISRSQLAGLGYAGGAANGGIQKLIHAVGRSDASKKCSLTCADTRISQQWLGAGTARIWRLNNTADLGVFRVDCSQSAATAYEDGGSGTNTEYGVGGGDPTTFHNIFSQDLVRW